ncbi:MAG: hypothetical protein JJ891_16880 [Rhizobiaceae bacterium]|nr:hypothetical protein [Rhizobiaceae bacterium]
MSKGYIRYQVRLAEGGASRLLLDHEDGSLSVVKLSDSEIADLHGGHDPGDVQPELTVTPEEAVGLAVAVLSGDLEAVKKTEGAMRMLAAFLLVYVTVKESQ